GWIRRGSVREGFEPAVDALFGLDEGEISTIVEGGDGFFLVRCDEIDEPVTPDFETLQPELADRYFKVQYNRLVMERVEKLRQQAHIAQDDLNRFFVAVIEAGIKRIAK
ncbi:MAG: peptidyl-prolyl cis-trans isomerase, partial [Planctomycetes bacterium]|nr:peptidyl-prolyl cis-trans isomerase [Planctomycetota bacterium]